MARKRWKNDVGDNILAIALIISILRIDISQYLTNYSQYPEVQQVLLGQSVGLQAVDNSYRGGPTYPSKYVNDTEYILSELNRLTESVPAITVRQYISTWLVTENSTPTPPLQVLPQQNTISTNSRASASELSRQDIDLIELLWKQNTSLLDRAESNPQSTAFETNLYLPDSQLWDDITEGAVAPPQPFKYEEDDLDLSFGAGNRQLLPDEPMPSTSYHQPRPLYQTQSSLDLELEDIPPYLDNPVQVTNSSMMEPSYLGFSQPEFLDTPLHTNSTGIFHGDTLLTQSYDDLDPMPLLNDTLDLDPSILDDFNIDPTNAALDMELDTSAYIPDINIRDSISEDSALSLGSSSPSHYSWSDRISESSDEAGAVGYTNTDCKMEPFDNGVFDLDLPLYEPVGEKGRIRHDHTYSAPPGGVPHVRKMDIKVPKEPSRGLAHDELICRKMKIPFSVEKIIDSPVDEFNALLRKYPLSAKQANLVKDIRRRGKNKVAAQNCRKKKIVEVSDLELEVDSLKSQRDNLNEQKSVLLRQSSEVRKQVDIMSAEIFRTLRDENGMPYNSSQVTLEVGANGEITIAPINRSTRKKPDNKKRRRQ